jgi:hypothetical protein
VTIAFSLEFEDIRRKQEVANARVHAALQCSMKPVRTTPRDKAIGEINQFTQIVSDGHFASQIQCQRLPRAPEESYSSRSSAIWGMWRKWHRTFACPFMCAAKNRGGYLWKILRRPDSIAGRF